MTNSLQKNTLLLNAFSKKLVILAHNHFLLFNENSALIVVVFINNKHLLRKLKIARAK